MRWRKSDVSGIGVQVSCESVITERISPAAMNAVYTL